MTRKGGALLYWTGPGTPIFFRACVGLKLFNPYVPLIEK